MGVMARNQAKVAPPTSPSRKDQRQLARCSTAKDVQRKKKKDGLPSPQEKQQRSLGASNKKGSRSSSDLTALGGAETSYRAVKVSRRPHLAPANQDSKEEKEVVPAAVVSMISQALTDMFFLGSAMFASMQEVSTSFCRESFEKGDVVVRQGDEGDRMYVISSGGVKFFQRKNEQDVCVGEAREGDVVGELALFYGGKRAATIVAGKNGCEMYSIKREQFRDLAAVDRGAQSLTLRAVTLRSTPSLSRLSRRQIYTLARAMKGMDLNPGEAFADDPHGKPFESLLLVQEGSVKVTAKTTRGDPVDPQTLHSALFPRTEMASQLITTDDEGVVCDTSALLGLHLLIQRLINKDEECVLATASLEADGDGDDENCESKESSEGKSPFNLTIVAGPGGCRVHSVTLSNLCAHLGNNIPQLILGSTFDDDNNDAAATEDAAPESPLAASYLSIEEAIAQSPGARRGEGLAQFKKGDFALRKLLGQGSYGCVVKATLNTKRADPKSAKVILSDFPDGVVALKLMAKTRVVQKRQLNHVFDERRLLLRMGHPNVMRLMASFQDEDTLYLVTEFIDGPDLWSVIYEPSAVGYPKGHRLRDASDALLQLYCACVVQALSHIHNQGIVYRDLKPENVMVAQSGYLKIVDFGFAKQLPYYTSTTDDDSHTTSLHAHFKAMTLCGTCEYLSPEMIQCTGHDWASDIWGAACLFHELAVGHTPFIERHGEADDIIMQRIVQSRIKPCIPPFRLARRKFMSKLVDDCLKHDPTERLGAEELLQHKFFESLNWEAFVNQAYVPEWKPNGQLDSDNDDDENVEALLDIPVYPDTQSIFEAFSA